jgi:putative membrane protein
MLSACNGNANQVNLQPSLNTTDQNFIVGATQASNAEIGDAKIALSKTSNPDIISFANEMITQHTQEEQALAPIASAVNDPAPPMTSLNATQQAQATALQQTAEPAFDALYINGTIQGHTDNINNNYNPEISSGENPQVVQYAKTYLPQVTMHLQMAQAIKAKYGF